MHQYDLEGNRKKLLYITTLVDRRESLFDSLIFRNAFPNAHDDQESFQQRLGEIFCGDDEDLWLWLFGVHFDGLDRTSWGLMRRLLYVRQFGEVPVMMRVLGVTQSQFQDWYQNAFPKINLRTDYDRTIGTLSAAKKERVIG